MRKTMQEIQAELQPLKAALVWKSNAAVRAEFRTLGVYFALLEGKRMGRVKLAGRIPGEFSSIDLECLLANDGRPAEDRAAHAWGIDANLRAEFGYDFRTFATYADALARVLWEAT